MKRLLLSLPFFSILAAGSALAAFSFEDDGSRLTILEDENPVLVYNYGRMDPPEGMGAHYWRSNYVHPVYGMDGEILTQDFPADHAHHRGTFWTWPTVTVDERKTDPWTLRGSRQLFMDWVAREANETRAFLSFRAGWRFDEQWEPFIVENVEIVAHPAEEDHRVLDFVIRLENVSSVEVTIAGSGASGYGGFNFRPDANRAEPTFVTATGKLEEDALNVETPWVDFSSKGTGDGRVAGAAIFQHPQNPGYPHPGWILRHYGFLGHSWPHYEEKSLAPGDSVTLRYRLLIHRGDAEEAGVAEHFGRFEQEAG